MLLLAGRMKAGDISLLLPKGKRDVPGSALFAAPAGHAELSRAGCAHGADAPGPCGHDGSAVHQRAASSALSCCMGDSDEPGEPDFSPASASLAPASPKPSAPRYNPSSTRSHSRHSVSPGDPSSSESPHLPPRLPPCLISLDSLSHPASAELLHLPHRASSLAVFLLG